MGLECQVRLEERLLYDSCASDVYLRVMNEQGLAFLVCSNLNRNQCCDANMAVLDGHMLRRQFLTDLFCPYVCS
jgi:hypothetical protein